MKLKTSELTDAALDWAVAKCEWVRWTFETATTDEIVNDCHYSTDWAQGGPIIEREEIAVSNKGGVWAASVKMSDGSWPSWGYGPTPLIAAMRCYVASKLLDEVDVPEELCK